MACYPVYKHGAKAVGSPRLLRHTMPEVAQGG
jgi:hypothetical protein